MKKTVTIIVVFILVVFFVGGAYLTRKKARYPTIEAVKVGTSNLVHEVSSNGVIKSKEHITVISEVSGKINSVFVKEGDRVKAGDLIALIDTKKILVKRKASLAALASARKSVKEELLNLRAAYNRAKINYEQALRELKNTEELYKIQSASDEQLSAARDKLKLAEETYQSAKQRLNLREGRNLNDPRKDKSRSDFEIIEGSVEVQHARASLEEIDNDLANCRIKSPIDGIVTRIAVEKGAVVGPGSLIAEVQDYRNLEVVVNIDEVDIGYIRIGQKVRIESDTFINSALNGHVTYIAPVIIQRGDTRTCEVKIDIKDPDHLAKIGASCFIYITVEKKVNVPAIGIDEYVLDKDKKYVFKLVKSVQEEAGNAESESIYKIVKTEIKTGIIGIENIEVVSGLEPGDLIAKGNIKSLSDGQFVKVKKVRKDK